MNFNKSQTVLISSLLSSIALYSCAKKQVQVKSPEENLNMQINKIANSSANMNLNDIHSIDKLKSDNIAIREKYCALESTKLKDIIKKIALDYNNKNLLDLRNKDYIPLINILTQTKKITEETNQDPDLPYACYYPEIYLANAIAMDSLQRIPFSPFNQESLQVLSQNKKAVGEIEDWEDPETLRNSRFAKLNGLIRSATIAYKIALLDKEKIDFIPRMSSEIENKKIYLFENKENEVAENYYSKVSGFANALAAIGHYERALYRWNGVFSASELNMPVKIPNENIQDIFNSAKNSLPEPYHSEYKDSDTVALKHVIAQDLLLAERNMYSALNSSACKQSKEAGQSIPAHMLNLCPKLEKMQETVRKVDLKRLVCSSSSAVPEAKSPDDLIGNYLWEELDCQTAVEEDPSLLHSSLDSKGVSYNSIAPFSLNPLRLTETTEDFAKSFEYLKNNISHFNILQTKDFQEKRKEISENIEALKAELEIGKAAQNKAAQEIVFAQFQADAAKYLNIIAQNEEHDAQTEQKIQFRNYVRNLSSIQTLKKLKETLNRYSSDKNAAIDKYIHELCGHGGTGQCSGQLGKLGSLYRERAETSATNWKNDCGNLVRQLNTTKRIIGENGCDVSSLIAGVQFSKKADEIYKQIDEIISKNKDSLSNTCKAAVVSEALFKLDDDDFEKALKLDSKDSSKISTLKASLIKMRQDFASQLSAGNSANNSGYFTSLKNDMNYIKSIAEMNSEKIFLEQTLNVNSYNTSQLSSPKEYCGQLLENARNGSSTPIASLLDVKIAEEQNNLQKLQLIYSAQQSESELQYIVQEKIVQLDDQIYQFEKISKNLEENLGIIKEFSTQVKNSISHLNTDEQFDTFYATQINNIKFSQLKNAKLRKLAEENKYQTAHVTVKMAMENHAIAELQNKKLNLAIKHAQEKAEAHTQSNFVFTSMNPNVKSFSADIWKINYVGELAQQMLRSAANRMLNMDPNLRNIAKGRMYLIAENMANTKLVCSYLASFDDAQNCLMQLKLLQDDFSFKNEKNYGKVSNNFTLKIYSKELREQKKHRAKYGEQAMDDIFIQQLNQNGAAKFNLDEDFLVRKGFLPRSFNNDYYRARIIGITVNIFQENPIDTTYINRPFDASANIAYLLHDGLGTESNLPHNCSPEYASYSKNLYNQFMNELLLPSNKDRLENLGKNFPYIFNYEPLQEMMCGKLNALHSPASTLSQSLIRYVNAEGQELPISIFNNATYTETKAKIGSKNTSYNWLHKLYNDFNSSPSIDDGYWQPMTGYISDINAKGSDLSELSTRIFDCLVSSDIDSSNCSIARKSVYQSFAGFPFLGNYSFVYAQHYRDELENSELDENEQTKIKGLEINFIISK